MPDDFLCQFFFIIFAELFLQADQMTVLQTEVTCNCIVRRLTVTIVDGNVRESCDIIAGCGSQLCLDGQFTDQLAPFFFFLTYETCHFHILFHVLTHKGRDGSLWRKTVITDGEIVGLQQPHSQ